MRAAPAVDYPLACSGFWQGGAALCASAACAALAWWAASGWETSLWLACSLSLGGATVGAAAGWRAGRGRPGQLVWNGQSWTLRELRLQAQASVEAGSPEIALDWGDWVLLRWHGSIRRGWTSHRWLPLARRDLPRAWHALRVALRAPQPLPGGTP